MTKIQKTVSDLMMQLSNQILVADEIDKTQTLKLRNLTNRILRKSVRNKTHSKSIMTLGKFTFPFFTNKKKLKKLALTHKYRKNHLEKSLDNATQIIQKTNAKNLFNIIEMNMKDCPEKTIELVIRSFTWKTSLKFNGMTLLEGEIKKISLMENEKKV